ncbi:hypothetical protein [Streptomyces sp. NPDC006384]|uniref:hypothetical protein n=1 Tax=Streptomyces sp. NPDC006384 TaxID=3364745 RepID=UPI0036880464
MKVLAARWLTRARPVAARRGSARKWWADQHADELADGKTFTTLEYRRSVLHLVVPHRREDNTGRRSPAASA